MKIVRIEAVHVTVPLIQPYVLSKKYGTVTHSQAVVVKLSTDEGLCGFGEADPMPPFTSDTWGGVFAAIEHHLGPCLLGQDPRQITRHNRNFDQVLSGNLLAKAALDVALWDLWGKILGVPVHALLGGALRDRIPLLWPLGSGTPQEDVERIKGKMEEGFRTFMIKMGALPIDTEIARAHAIEEAFGGNININMDANQGWDLPQTLRFMDATRGCHLDFVEQPVPRERVAALSTIRAHATHPLSADEGLQTIQDATELCRDELVDVFSLKIAKNGGLQRSRAIGSLAWAFGIKCMMNSMIELGISQAAALHLGASLPNLLDCGQCYMSTLRLQGDVSNFSDLVHDAVATVPDGPGLGIELDEDALGHYGQERMVLE